MRVILTLAFPPWRGGMQRLMYQRCLLTPEQVVVAAPGRGRSEAWDRAQPFPIWRWPGGPRGVPGWRRARQTGAALAALLALGRRFPLGELELGQALPFGLVALWARRAWGLPYSVWAFGDEIIKPARHPLARPVLARVLEHARAVYAVSRYTAALVRPFVSDPARVRVVHPWPAPYFTPGAAETARARLSLPDRAPILLTVARLEPRKGVDRVLRALPLLRQAFPDLVYAVVGAGRARRPWRALAERLGVADHLVWAGDVADAELPFWYRAADVFVLTPTPGPGEVEGFGLVYVEAAACATPSVAGVDGGTPEAVRHRETGLLVFDPGPDALAEAIGHLLRAPDLRATMGRRGVAHAERLREEAARAIIGMAAPEQPAGEDRR